MLDIIRQLKARRGTARQKLEAAIQELDAEEELISTLSAKISRAARVFSGAEDAAPDPVIVDPPAQPREPAVIAKPRPAPIPIPTGPGAFPGENSAALQVVLEDAAALAGIRWEVLKAIEVWETGHYGKNPAAHAWLDKNNPGGMKYSKTTQALGALPPDGGQYAEFTDWRAGIIAHGRFLYQSRYDAARSQTDPLAQAAAIGAAGYAEGSQTWLEGVQALIRQYLRTGPGTLGSAPPAPVITKSRAAIVARARSMLDKGVVYSLGKGGGDPTKPLPAESDCSGFADWALGISRDQTGLNTDALVHDGRTPGGLFDEVPMASALPADLLVYGAGKGHAYGHVGVITEVTGGKVTRVVHCHSGDPAIVETGPDVFTSRGAIVIRYHGLTA